MRIWRWFCALGKKQETVKRKAAAGQDKSQRDQLPESEICSRLCGANGCRCGGTMRGLYCLWSYYRMEEYKK